MIRLLWFLILILTASACGVVNAVEAFFIGSTEAVEATADAARQAEDTLHTLQHLLIYIPVYLAGEARKPLWGKLKSLNGKRRSKKASA